ncbi:MAG: exodeoxyribonuclease VII small subunit [Planctomycetota bacterium]|nr:exodeoxyribonuclease VII small subunit [Planctomycetota bacterium]
MAIKKNSAQKFESSLSDLEEIVRELENSQLSLKEAEQKIQLLSGVDASGQPLLQKFNHESTEGKEQQGLFSVEKDNLPS